MGDAIDFIVLGLHFIVGYNLLLPIIFYAFFILKRNKIYKADEERAMAKQCDYAIIVTAYKETTHLNFVIDSILKMNYKKFMVYIVADSCDVSALNFADERVVVLEPERPLSSNVKSHFYAIDRFIRPHDHLTIIDSDNLVHPEYLNEINKYFHRGFSAVQGLRKAKNLNTQYACLDAARDIYYHYFDGAVIFKIGSSATLAGSGMAFKADLYKECLAHHLEMEGAGFDKILQTELVTRGYQIAYAEKAIVFDEKTAHSGQLVRQRTRWIKAWFKYFRFGFSLIEKGVEHKNKNQFLFGIVLLKPPIFISLLLSFICLALDVVFYPYCAIVWLLIFNLFLASFMVALLRSDTSPKIYSSLFNIPKFMFYQLISLMRSRKVDTSIATEHYSNISINERLRR